MSEGMFIFPELEEEEVRPAAFGYWSARWSDDLARQTLDDLSSGRFDGCSTYMQSYLTRLQLLALYTSTYWAYAIYILKTPAEYVEEMKVGMADCIKEYSGPNDGLISNELIAAFDSFFKRSFKAIGDDINDDTDPDVYNPDINNVAKSFIEAIEFYNFKGDAVMPEIEKTYLGQIVANVPPTMFDIFKSQGLAFNA